MGRAVSPFIDLSGDKYGLLTVVVRVEGNRWGSARWLCECDCGGEKVATARWLRQASNPSCGCLHHIPEHLRPTHRAWAAMKGRCLYPCTNGYHNYGGRGITVCAEWMASFEAFHAHIGTKPGSAYSVDRIDVDGNYEPGNVRWATASEQAQNKRPPGRKIDMTGQRFGRWTVLRFDPEDRREGGRWICQCDCGIERSVNGPNLRNGQSVSCGCSRIGNINSRKKGT